MFYGIPNAGKTLVRNCVIAFLNEILISAKLTCFIFYPGVTRQVGDALQLERSQRAGRVVSIGIAPWGIVEGANDLIGKGRDVPYHAMASPRFVITLNKIIVINNSF